MQAPNQTIQCADRRINYQTPIIMGVLNITPDSFSDGGNYLSLDKAVARAKAMQQQGATVIDIGGQSTKPGAEKITAKQELARVIPVIEAVKAVTDCVISVDTSKPIVMQAAIEAGAKIINDVRALSEPGALDVVANSHVAVCLTHHQILSNLPCHAILAAVSNNLIQAAAKCLQAGIQKNRIILDPGINFGKTYQQSLHLLKHLQQLAEMGYPLLLGLSRKLTKCIAKEYEQRVYGDLALTIYGLLNGANIIRSHEVKAVKDAITMLQQIEESD